MIAQLLTLLLVTGPQPQQIPTPQPPPPGGGVIEVPSGPLPWTLPILPGNDYTPVSPALVLTPLPTSTQYATMQANAASSMATMQAPIDTLSGSVDDVIGVAGVVPNMDDPDFDTGLDPLGDGNLTAYDIVDKFGEDLGTAFSYIRALTQLNPNGGSGFMSGAGVLVLSVLGIGIWFAIVRMIVFGINFGDVIWNKAVQVYTAIMDFIPF